MRIHYGVLLQGQGHLNRAATMVRVLRGRGHRVRVWLAGDTPPSYARELLGPFEHHALPNLTLDDGRLVLARTAAAFARSVPRRLALARDLARRLARARIELALTDFEPVTGWASRVAGVPCVGVAGQYRLTRTDAQGPRAPVDRPLTRALIESWTPGLAQYFAVSFSAARATRPRTLVVSPIVDEAVRSARPVRRGFVLAYLYSYPKRRVLEALGGQGRFRVYGLGAGESARGVEFCATDRASFVRDLAGCDGVILNGSFQGVCEAAVLGKPVLSIPFAGQYEEAFNAHWVERARLGVRGRLDAESVRRFARFVAPARAPWADGALEVCRALGL